MKQHITIEQLNELSVSDKDKLREWWKPEYGDWFAYHYLTYKGVHKYKEYLYVDEMGYDIIDPTIAQAWDFDSDRRKDRCLPLLSIGQMIEFLDENDPGEWAMNNTNSDCWYINSQNLYEPKYFIPDNAELCDSLWQAVKDVLNPLHNK